MRADAWNLDINRAMDAAGVAPGMVVGEAGAGDGYFTLPMARRVGPAGAVYANDISTRALNRLASSARHEGLANIQVVVGGVDDPRFPRQDLELVVIVHAFHDFSQPVEWLRNVRKYLKPRRRGGHHRPRPCAGRRRPLLAARAHPRVAHHAGFEMTKFDDGISQHLVIVLKPRLSP